MGFFMAQKVDKSKNSCYNIYILNNKEQEFKDGECGYSKRLQQC